MKALSVRQPWAFAITIGAKPVENRDWQARNPGLRFRGKFLIHASLRVEKSVEEDVLYDIEDDLNMGMNEVRIQYAGERLGAIVGAATLVDVVDYHPSKWFFGPKGLVLKDAVRAVKPVDCKGMLGFFNCPADVLERLHIPGYVENGKVIA